MHDGTRRVNHLRLISSFVGTVAAAVVLSPPANADDDLFTPSEPSIVTGATVDTQATIVVDPATTPATTDPNPPPVVTSAGPRKPVAYVTGRLQWFPDANPPVFAVDERKVDNRTAYLDNHGRYWVVWRDNNTRNYILEQVGGWPVSTEAPPPPKLAPNQSDFFNVFQ